MLQYVVALLLYHSTSFFLSFYCFFLPLLLLLKMNRFTIRTIMHTLRVKERASIHSKATAQAIKNKIEISKVNDAIVTIDMMLMMMD